MVPKVAGKGKSFKGAGLYYLHDKKASTANRVAFTLTENLPTANPELALRFMPTPPCTRPNSKRPAAPL
jgi:hypothetical protein